MFVLLYLLSHQVGKLDNRQHPRQFECAIARNISLRATIRVVDGCTKIVVTLTSQKTEPMDEILTRVAVPCCCKGVTALRLSKRFAKLNDR